MLAAAGDGPCNRPSPNALLELEGGRGTAAHQGSRAASLQSTRSTLRGCRACRAAALPACSVRSACRRAAGPRGKQSIWLLVDVVVYVDGLQGCVVSTLPVCSGGRETSRSSAVRSMGLSRAAGQPALAPAAGPTTRRQVRGDAPAKAARSCRVTVARVTTHRVQTWYRSARCRRGHGRAAQ